ncbi:MAG: molybdate ABC transporter substrate-binding protein [Clostridiales bacterium]|nr:molybdate ABC transporter substrate-binding protein [Eubacteriales bacterium]MDH7566077.1 molybdate ABC transporter substrate-binding protein [Clostridiales bacterium]
MMKVKRFLAVLIAALILTGITACGAGGSGQSQAPAAQEATKGTTKQTKNVALTVSAAASLKDAMEEIKKNYESEKPGTTITYNFGASGSLQQQIEQGADVDVFVSAAEKQMNALEEKGLLLDDTRKDLLGNRVVLVVPKDSTAVGDFKDLTGEKVRKVALGEPASVPAGQYAEEALTKLGMLDAVKSKAVYGKDVKTVLAWVETGDADAGIVYETDAKVSHKVKVAAAAPQNSYTPVTYPAAVIKAGKNTDSAREFINYLYSEKSKPVFEKYGFTYIAK